MDYIKAFLIGGIAVKASYPGVPVVKNIKVTDVTQSSAKITWSPCDNVSGYIVCTASGSKITETKSTSYKVSNQNPGTLSKYVIKSYVEEDGEIYDSPSSDVVKVLTKPAKVGKIYFDNLKNNRVDLSWNAAAGANKYIVYMSKNGGRYDVIKETSSLSCTINNLTGCTTYSFKIYSAASLLNDHQPDPQYSLLKPNLFRISNQ